MLLPSFSDTNPSPIPATHVSSTNIMFTSSAPPDPKKHAAPKNAAGVYASIENSAIATNTKPKIEINRIVVINPPPNKCTQYSVSAVSKIAVEPAARDLIAPVVAPPAAKNAAQATNPIHGLRFKLGFPTLT